jgi:hypothetical protein
MSQQLGMSLALSGLAALLAVAEPASAHHSFAMYDQNTLVTIDGTVKEFQWSNPHALLWVLEKAKDGEPPQEWTVELPTSPGNLTRLGWTKHSLEPGDRVTLDINPLRDGKHGGSFKRLTIVATGKVLVVDLRGQPQPQPEDEAK